MRFLFLLFLIVPLVEIYFLIQVGSVIGAGWTIFLVVFTAVLGAFLVRAQGFSTLAKVQSQLARSEMPAMEIIEGVFLFVAGALLLTPGFFTDAIGFACLTPPLRRAVIRHLMKKGMGIAGMHPSGFGGQRPKGESGRIIDAEYKDID